MNLADQAPSAVEALVREQIGERLLAVDRPHADTLRLRIAREGVVPAAGVLVRSLRARFMITIGTDQRPADGTFGVDHLFSLDREQRYVVLHCDVSEQEPWIPSIVGVVPGAAWAERELRDVVGIVPDGHPDPRRLLLADDWPEGIYPLRRDFPWDEKPPSVEGVSPPLADPPPGASVVPIGPFFPVLEEPAYFRLFVEGETVVGCDYRGFYNHRGIEKMADATLTYNEIPYVAERICGICGFIHSTAYCQAVEKAAEIAVPRRARYLRTLMLELERLHSHLLWMGIAGHILGFDTVLMQTWRMREPVMWLCEQISGNRKTYGMNTVGGVRRDLPSPLIPRILEIVAQAEKDVLATRDAIVGDVTLHARTKDVGPLSRSDAEEICVVGPPARASGVPIDARIDHPYAAYDEIPVRIALQQAGDTWARVLVRVEETIETIRLIRETLAALPDGPVCAEISAEVPAGRIGISVVEAPRGEAIHAVITGGDNRPYRWRVRAPTYPNLQAVPLMVAQGSIADVPITLGSLDPCFSCTERLEIVDLRTRQVRIYSERELLELSGRPRKGAVR